MVGFRDLVGTSIAPVSKKAAVKCDRSQDLSHRNVFLIRVNFDNLSS